MLLTLSLCSISLYFIYYIKNNKNSIAYKLLQIYTYFDIIIQNFKIKNENIYIELFENNQLKIIDNSDISKLNKNSIIIINLILEQKHFKNIILLENNPTNDIHFTQLHTNYIYNTKIHNTNIDNLDSIPECEESIDDYKNINTIECCIKEQDKHKDYEDKHKDYEDKHKDYEDKHIENELNTSDSLDDTDLFLQKIINYNSPIISCSITINDNDNNVLYSDYDITILVNSYISYNCELLLSNNNIYYKQLWVFLLNNYLKDKNIYLNLNNKIIWKIITQNIEIYENSELNIVIKEGKCNITNS